MKLYAKRGTTLLARSVALKTPALLVLSRFAVIGANLLTGVFLARGLAVEARGVLATVVAMPGLAAMAMTAGLDSATLRLSGKEAQRRAAIRAAYRRGVLALALAVIVCPVWLVVAPQPLSLEVRFAWAVSILLIPVLVLNQLLGNCAIGAKKTALWTTATAVNSLVYLTLSATLFFADLTSLIAFLSCYAASNLLSLSVLLSWSRKFQASHDNDDPSAALVMRSTAIGTAIPTVAQLAMLRVPLPLMSITAGVRDVGVLAVALPFAESLLIIPVMVTSYLLPRYHANGATLIEVRRHAKWVLFCTTALGVVIAALAPVLIERVYGGDYASAVPVIEVLLPGVAIFSYGRSMQAYLFSRGRYASVTVAAILGLAVSVVVQVATAAEIGSLGGALGILSGYAVSTGIVIAGLRYFPPSGAT
ncbi:lipopolysaccharide biosynthesis protein [Terrabacter terrigena]|uniref:Lipopolysaccharide biosynthesis protein n=1 Tax=Terrabacter terrigena TaxID=574718 RepID=A0ABW3MV12_9MICO